MPIQSRILAENPENGIKIWRVQRVERSELPPPPLIDPFSSGQTVTSHYLLSITLSVIISISYAIFVYFGSLTHLLL